jgi:CheY-like chemotaxis protein/two-component sensor histidine kinase
LNAIKGYIYLLQNSTLYKSEKAYLDKLQFSTNTLLAIIEDILDLTKIESGKFELDIQEFELERVLQHVHDLLYMEAAGKNLDFFIEVENDVPAWHVGDPVRLGQILVNLCGNAIKYTLSGEVKLKVQLEKMSAGDGLSEGNLLNFSVTDTGIGLKEKDIKKIFEPFSQVETPLGQKSRGKGLGLAICQQLVTLMNGEIRVESEFGKGSRFQLSLPLYKVKPGTRPPGDDQEKSSLSASSKDRVEGLAGLDVLLVDDNDFNLEVTKNILELKGCKVYTARNASHALQALREVKKVNIILMDLQMPGIDGIEASRKIRQVETFKEIPIIALTAHAMIREKEKCLAMGMNDYLAKPFEADHLFELILKHVGQKGTGESPKTQLPPLPKKKENNGQEMVEKEEALHKLEGNVLLYQKVLNRFLRVYGNLPEALEKDLATGAHDKIKQTAHDLKNAYGTIGAYQLIDFARQIEHGENDQWHGKVQQFIEQNKQLIDEVHQLVAGYDNVQMPS